MNILWLIKLLVTIVVVLSLSSVAEHASPRVAGVLSGYPLGAAISLFFYGYEISPEFASRSAVFTMIGLAATQVFVYCYYKSSLIFQKNNILSASTAAIAGYFLASGVLRQASFTLWTALAGVVCAMVFFIYLFRDIKNVTIEKRIRLTPAVLFIRAATAAAMVLLITGVAKWVGPEWAGLFSAFPVTLFPLILIVHFTYSDKHVHTIIKNFPTGLGALIIYVLSVSLSYPRLGIYAGTAVSFAAATAYLIAYALAATRRRPTSIR